MQKFALLAIVLAAGLAAGCRPSLTSVPQDYLRMESPGPLYAERAVSADGVYLAVRRSESAQGGNLSFWTKAVGNELLGRGYLPAGQRQVTSADGVGGVQMDFAYTRDGSEYGYAAAVWVAAGRVIVAEAGGPKEAFDADRERLNAALAGVRLR